LRVFDGLILVGLHVLPGLGKVLQRLSFVPAFELALAQLVVLAACHPRLRSTHPNTFAQGFLHEVDAFLSVPHCCVEIRQQFVEGAMVQVGFLEPVVSNLKGVFNAPLELVRSFLLYAPFQVDLGQFEGKGRRWFVED
jgi:hypothetical protein